MTGRLLGAVGAAVVLAAGTWVACSPPPAGDVAQVVVDATPRLSDGRPDLNGVWGGGGGGDADRPDAKGNLTVLTKGRPCSPFQNPCAPAVNFERDSRVVRRVVPGGMLAFIGGTD